MLCVRFSDVQRFRAVALHVIDSDADTARIEGGRATLVSDPGIWVTQPLALTREITKKWRRAIARSIAVSVIEHSTKDCSVHWRFQLSVTIY